MIERLSNYINDNEFRFTVYDNKIYISNYNKIISLEDNNISLTSNTKKIVMKGTNLLLKKILDKELLIIGNIKSIEVLSDEQ